MLLTEVGLLSHLLAAAAFAALAVAALWRQRGPVNLWFAAAAAVTAIWGGLFAAAVWFDEGLVRWMLIFQTLKVAAWIGLLIVLLRPTWQDKARGRSAFLVGGAIGFAVALQLVLDYTGVTGAVLAGNRSVAGQIHVAICIAISVSGLVLAHNLYVNSDVGTRSGLRLLAIGLGGLFLYDLNFYTLAFLLPPPSGDLYNIRGAATTLTVPLLLFATRDSWTAQARVSRQLVFHTVAFTGVGFYLIAMALLAYGLRLAGGSWGMLLQVTFLFGTTILAMVVLVSPRFRAWLRVQIAKNFFRYKYDYRAEWLRFIATVGQPGDAAALPARVVQAVATVFDSEGGLLLIADDAQLAPAVEWNLRGVKARPIPLAAPLVQRLLTLQRVLDLDALRAGHGDDEDRHGCPDWLLADRRLWLAVPLVHRDGIVALLVLRKSLVPRALNWEDWDLLRTLGRQAASYIAENASQAALDEAERFEEFNRRFAFILHDIKNLVSQLSLVARNAERHADNPEFRADMVATLQGSVGKMNALLGWLSQRPSGGAAAATAPGPVPLDLVLRQVVRSKQGQWPGLTLAVAPGLDAPGTDATVAGDGARLEQLFIHLIQNAIDASPPGAAIAVTLAAQGGDLVVEIADHGHGMSPRFIRQELFQPFRSTKPGGFGIGAYEAREIARAHGGRLEVESREGEGTIFTVVLPRLVPAAIAAQ